MYYSNSTTNSLRGFVHILTVQWRIQEFRQGEGGVYRKFQNNGFWAEFYMKKKNLIWAKKGRKGRGANLRQSNGMYFFFYLGLANIFLLFELSKYDPYDFSYL